VITISALGNLGRLGNSLFQIASITGIADKLNTSAVFPKWRYEYAFKNPLPKTNALINTTPILEPNFTYDEAFINSLKPDEINNLHGWFQTEKYWSHCKEKVLEQFEFSDTIINKVSFRFKTALAGKNVAISIRRGDFVNNPNYFQLLISYYLNAYYTHFKGYNAIIFSDDIEYCKTHFKAIPGIYYADLSDIEQLCLMSLCDNHIISNSTFSWWGAYLSFSQKVIRPEKNFAGDLAKNNSEKDYWPKGWQVFKDYQIDLSDTTFIIPVHYDHSDRRQNLHLTLAFLNTHFNTNILIGEQGGNHFEELEDYAEYFQFKYKEFHRTRMINEMVKMAKTPIVINWDADNLCTPAQIVEAVNSIRDGADISYPFDGTVYRVPRIFFNKAVESLDVTSIPTKSCVAKQSSVGHAIVMNKESFIKAGMENENFISWTPEDSERFNRYKILGLTVQRIPGAIYHMDHYCGVNSSAKNPFFKDGEAEYMNVVRKNKQQLQEYIKTWTWTQ
jgi:hypothetical protein